MDQDSVSHRAHAMWGTAGKPEAAHNDNWRQARRETELENVPVVSEGDCATGMPVEGASPKRH